MATANFRSMKEFDLYVLEDGAFYLQDEEGNIDYESVDDGLIAMIDYDIKKLNQSFSFYNIEMLDGYYSGLQLYVKTIYEPADENEMNREKELVKASLQKLADNFGFIKLKVSARFSNGETWYERAVK